MHQLEFCAKGNGLTLPGELAFACWQFGVFWQRGFSIEDSHLLSGANGRSLLRGLVFRCPPAASWRRILTFEATAAGRDLFRALFGVFLWVSAAHPPKHDSTSSGRLMLVAAGCIQGAVARTPHLRAVLIAQSWTSDLLTALARVRARALLKYCIKT